MIYNNVTNTLRAWCDDMTKAYMNSLLLKDFDAFYHIDSFAMLYVWGQKDGSYLRFYNSYI